MLTRRIPVLAFAAAILCTPFAVAAQASTAPRVQAIRFWSFGDVTRIAIQTDGAYKLHSDQIDNPPRLFFDLAGLRAPTQARHGIERIQVNDQRIKEIRVAQESASVTRIVFDLASPVEVVSSQLVNPDRLMIEVRPKGTALSGLSVARTLTGSKQADTPALLPPNPVAPVSSAPAITPKPSSPIIAPPATVPTKQAEPVKLSVPLASALKDAQGDRSLVRVFGLKLGRVVIDAGHGGHDTGTIGPSGLFEKDLVLDVALRLGALISKKLGAEVIYTRSSDVFIPLEERTKIANEQKADLFISVHANSSPESSATGVETYYFNLTSDKRGLDLATRENASAASSISDLNDLLHRAVLQTKMEESRDFAQRVQGSLSTMSVKMNSKAKDRGVRQAPFVVLIGATMPSILAEIGFVSNPHDEKLMRRGEQRQKIAEALFQGIAQYARSLNHTELARAGS